eukprot:TRINITY_DN6167_c0_g1_i2.p1 TRINITY_DN6167_c0_g1~~TRINITY_DN6167_c0_g1_i2.p1  ORF type:complete len:369 (-),score=151.25 TRINITY_DN6167_c0_g1_i2:552-1658(-)
MSVKDSKEESTSLEGDYNPYKEPPLQKIFTYKDEQKKLKEAERERNATLKVWEKSKPKNEGLIRAINGIKGRTDTASEETKGKSNRDPIDSMLPGERRKRTEAKHELVEKKKDMFLLQMMLDLKKKEIQKMDDFKRLRNEGLKYSEKMMAEDLENVKTIVSEMKLKSSDQIAAADEAARRNHSKDEDLKNIRERITLAHNRINRSTDSLENRYKYMLFFLRLQSKEYKPEERRGAGTNLSKELMATLNLRPELIKLIEDPRNDFALQFKKPQDLYELYLNLEEQNTTLIKRMQRLDGEIDVKRDEFAVLKKGKETQIERLVQAKEVLEKAIKDQRDAIQIIIGPQAANTKEYEEKWLKNVARIVYLCK